MPQWMLLMALSMPLAAMLVVLRVPAAMLLGPLISAVIVSARGVKLQVPGAAFVIAQGLLGCMIAGMLSTVPADSRTVDWLVIAVGVFSVIAASSLLGWLMNRLLILPGITALWGLSPGASTAMTLMAEASGADAQLVAFMQYLRVVVVGGIASLIATVWGVGTHPPVHHITWFPPIRWLPLSGTVALAVFGSLIASRLGFRAGALLVPLVAGTILSHQGWLTIELPPVLLTLGYAVIGWRIGLRFTRTLLAHVATALPSVLACTLALVVICAGFGGLLHLFTGVDPLTAYLAMSPGGADTIAIIAASTPVDAQFVMIMQMARFVAILIIGPPVVRFIAKHMTDKPSAAPTRRTEKASRSC